MASNNDNKTATRTRTVIVTGASDGLGAAFAELCVKNGVRVVNISRTPAGFPAPANYVQNIACDLTDPAQIVSACNQIKTKFPNFDAIINCAGQISIQPPDKIEYAQADRVMRLNAIAPMFLVSQLFGSIVKNGADIINVGSTVGTKAYPDQAAYGMSKWAMRGLSENLRVELKNTPCRVIQLNIGGMYTNFVAKRGTPARDFVAGAHTFDGDPLEWILPADAARIMFDILSYPKQIEVTEITVNRRGKRAGTTHDK